MQEKCPGRTWGPWRGAHAGAGFLAVPVTPWGTLIGKVNF